MSVEGIPGDLGAGIERDAEEIGFGPAQSPNGLAPLRLCGVFEAAEDLATAFAAEQISVAVIAFAARREADELDRSTGKRPRDVAANFECWPLIIFHEPIVALWPVGRHDMIFLGQLERAW